MDDIQAAQVAMFWDSEGTIGIWAQRRRRRPRAVYFRVGFSAGNTNLDLLNSIHSDIGRGCVRLEKQRHNPNAKPFWRLVIGQRDAEPILVRILPFLRAKKRQAELALAFLKLQRNNGRGGITQSLWEAQKALYLECGPLNQRGIQPFQSKAECVPFENDRDYDYIPYSRKARSIRKCEQLSCEEKHYAKGMCYLHYRKAHPEIYGRKKQLNASAIVR